MTLNEAIEFYNLNKNFNSIDSKKSEISDDEIEELLEKFSEDTKLYREEIILKGKHITETSYLLKNIYENFSYNDYELIDKILYAHLKNTKDDIFLLDSTYNINKYSDHLYITVYSKFKNYPKHFEQYAKVCK